MFWKWCGYLLREELEPQETEILREKDCWSGVGTITSDADEITKMSFYHLKSDEAIQLTGLITKFV